MLAGLTLILILLLTVRIFYCSFIKYNKNYNKKNIPSYLILTAQDDEEYIEGIVIHIIKILHNKENRDIEKIIIVDLGSFDETPQIMQKLSNKYDCVYIIALEEYNNLINEPSPLHSYN